MIKISLNDIITINEAAKALKQRTFIMIGNCLYGLDFINTYIIKAEINPDRLSPECITNIGLQFNQRELSNFVKVLSIESDFEVDINLRENKFYTKNGKNELNIIIDKNITNFVLDRIKYINNIDFQCKTEEDITNQIQDLYLLKKDDGGYYFIYKDKYYITLFYGLLPLNKNNKINLSIVDQGNIFISRFRINKKYPITVYIQYLNMKK